MSMKFKIIINRWANFYFFVQNLSDWHFSNRKEYNDLWRQELGNFSKEEESLLQKFKEIRLKYKETRSPFEQSFFLCHDPWKKLSEILDRDDYKRIEEVFKKIENKFDLIYGKDQIFLKQWLQKLDLSLNDSVSSEKIIKSLGTLFRVFSPKNKKTEVYLLLSSGKRSGGGANINNNAITLEISRYPISNLCHALGIVWHEIIHLYFQNEYFYPLLFKHITSNEKLVNLIIEITASSLFPRGVLGTELLINKSADKLLPQVDSNQTIKLINLSKEYLDSGRPLDDEYIDKVLKILEK